MSLQPKMSLQPSVYLQPEVWYVVTKGSNCGTFEKGDRICLLPDGAILVHGEGWIDPEYVFDAIKGMKVEVYKQQSLAKRREELERELRTLYEAKYSD